MNVKMRDLRITQGT